MVQLTGLILATGPKAGVARDRSRTLHFTLHCVACNWSNLSLIAVLRSLFWANKFPDPMLREFDW